ncbi:MAG TPA: membrane dipeptidase [Anaerolineales bacterium]|nr:membrane dipeptidase [Anaerolineales bacterium]
MLIVDAHLDLAWNALQWNRNLQHSVYTIRTQESRLSGAGRGRGTVALPEMRKGRVALCFATLLARSTGKPLPNLDYSSPLQANAIAQGQLAYYRALAALNEVRVITDLTGLEDHIDAWLEWEYQTDPPQPKLGLVISMESADPLLEPEQLAIWREAGVRIIGPAHYGLGRYAGGTSTENGFTAQGWKLLQEMESENVILDLTHLSDQAFWQALDRFSGVVLASHNNCRALVPHQRQFDDQQIRAIVSRDGVIGAAFDNWMIRASWTLGAKDNDQVTLAHVTDHIDHICQLAGDSQHAAIGSDLDGGFGREQSPSDLDTIADVQHIADILSQRGYKDTDIASIMHGNWLRLLRAAWNESH